MKINLSPFDTIVASEIARRRGKTVDALLSEMLQFEGCSELCMPEGHSDQTKLEATVIYAQTKQLA